MNLTNQQLAFARTQLEAARKAGATLSRRAHWQAGVFQLSLALECYARELQEQSKVRAMLEPGPKQFSRLSEHAQAAGTVWSEVEELAALERDSGSWLNRLMRWRANLVGLGLDERRRSVLRETSLTEAERRDAHVIELVDVDARANELPAFSDQLFEDAINAFATLVERQRHDSAEF